MPSKPKPSKPKKTKTPAKGTPKTFVLDTNVLLHDPRAIFGFGDNDVVIPIYVVEEIDSFKKDASELGRNAREISRHLDELRTAGSLAVGVPLPGGGKLTVATTHLELPEEVTTDRGPAELILKGEEDIRRLSQNRLLIADSHGIQFLVRDVGRLDRHSRKLLDRFL